MTLAAREALSVFVDGDEVPGVIVYALRSPGSDSRVGFPTSLWSGSEARPFRLLGESWEILGWDLPIREWRSGETWHRLVHRTLEELTRQGAVVAWIGAEGLPFSDPPGLFDPQWMSGSVLAALTSSGDFWSPLDPGMPVQSLTDEQLQRLRAHAHGLADSAA
jgi:hypothetical protein